jgi:hypothetical protein
MVVTNFFNEHVRQSTVMAPETRPAASRREKPAKPALTPVAAAGD